MPGARMRRVNEAVREVLSSHLAEGLKDPRIGFVTVTGVDTTPDLRFARVYVSVLGDEGEREAALEGLTSSRGFLQAQIAHELLEPEIVRSAWCPNLEPRGLALRQRLVTLPPDDLV